MSLIYLAHVTVYDPALPGERVLRYSTGAGFVTGADAGARPSGVAAHVHYEPRIKQPAAMRRDCFSRGATGGASQVGYGELVLVNTDGELDAYLDYGLDGRPVEIIVGHMSPWQAPTFVTVLKGTMEQPRIGWDSVAIRLRDRQAELSVPLQATRYAGNNSLPNGLEGVAGDLAGKPKPLAYGKVYNAPAPCVNTSKLTYQANDGAVADVAAVYDKGASLTKGSDYATSSLLQAATVTAGTYATCFAEGYFRLGSSPAGQVTADIVQGAAAANRTAAQIVKAIATRTGGILVADVVAADITALDTANSAEIGLWIDGETTFAAALDLAAGAVGAWWGFDRLGQFRVQRLEVPSGTPVATLTEADLLKIDRIETSDDGRGVPAWRVRLAYQRMATVQGSDLAGGVTDARRAVIGQEWRTVVSEDASVKTAHLLAPTLEFEAALVDASAAATEAARRLALYKTRRDRFEVRAAVAAPLLSAIDLGAVVELDHPRFQLSGGKLYRVIGIRADLDAGMLDLTLWG
jgi:hypothetical protein